VLELASRGGSELFLITQQGDRSLVVATDLQTLEITRAGVVIEDD
jgi:hypothetical protein